MAILVHDCKLVGLTGVRLQRQTSILWGNELFIPTLLAASSNRWKIFGQFPRVGRLSVPKSIAWASEVHTQVHVIHSGRIEHVAGRTQSISTECPISFVPHICLIDIGATRFICSSSLRIQVTRPCILSSVVGAPHLFLLELFICSYRIYETLNKPYSS